MAVRSLKHPNHVATVLGVVFSLAILLPIVIWLTKAPTPAVPYLSDLGKAYPEAAIFTFGFFVSALLALSLTVLRYLAVEELLKPEAVADRRLNKASLVFGVLAVPCFALIAAAPVNAVIEVHFLAFNLAWWNILAFQLLQTILTRRTLHGSGVGKFRLALTILTFISVIAFYMTFASVVNISRRKNTTPFQSVPPILQWCASLLMFVYYLTFARELKAAQLQFQLQVNVATSNK